jgi:hypothetical protein
MPSCPTCGNNDFADRLDSESLRTLAANIAIGAFGCKADELGYRRCTETNNPDAWRPGCQRPAP